MDRPLEKGRCPRCGTQGSFPAGRRDAVYERDARDVPFTFHVLYSFEFGARSWGGNLCKPERDIYRSGFIRIESAINPYLLLFGVQMLLLAGYNTRTTQSRNQLEAAIPNYVSFLPVKSRENCNYLSQTIAGASEDAVDGCRGRGGRARGGTAGCPWNADWAAG